MCKDENWKKLTETWVNHEHSKKLMQELEKHGFAAKPDVSDLIQLLVGTISSIEVELSNNFDCFSKKYIDI